MAPKVRRKKATAKSPATKTASGSPKAGGAKSKKKAAAKKTAAKKPAAKSGAIGKIAKRTVHKKALVIVESPSKAKTIQKYLGRSYIVKASVGHIKDLPKSKLGVDPEKGFKADYQLIPGKKKVLDELNKAWNRVDTVFIATDPDREGEAIAWHISEEIKDQGLKKNIHRVLLNSITKPAILNAMENPTTLNDDLYEAQRARRILDRLVGYKISPLLWDKVKRGLSAGRVQSVSVRLVVEREKEIKAFKPVEYWEVEGLFTKGGTDLKTRLFKIDGKDPELPNQATVDELVARLEKSDFKVKSIEQKERQRRPTPPFITSRLQQDAARRLGFSAKKTMTLAQRLYEGVDLGDLGTSGLITYMRTDSVRVEPGALESVREFIGRKYGADYVPEKPNFYKTRKGAQDAHEAIRPTAMELTPDRIKGFLERDEFRLYQLIWNRFVASQMSPAVYDQTTVDIDTQAGENNVVFRATGSVIKFPGFTAVYSESEGKDKDGEDKSELKLPQITPGDGIDLKKLDPSQHFTQPPPRYSDASLIRELEERGIGRPSTYASILTNILAREYVEKRENRYYPSELGEVVTELLIHSFPNILDSEFTAKMENQLDEIEEGTSKLKKTLQDFWGAFEKTLEDAKKYMKNIKAQEVPTDIKCEKCKNTMVIKWGKLGSFLACSNYPECKNTQDFKKDDQGKIVIVPKEFTDKICEKCSNPMVVKVGKYGKFLACSEYPNCKFTAPFTLGIPCPKCKEGEIAQKQSRYGRLFYSCNRWPNCDFASWDKPIKKPCPDCGFAVLTERTTKRAGLTHRCPNKECGYIEIVDPNAGKAPPEEQASA